MQQLDAIQIRDPFIVPVAEEQTYYLYGTTDMNCWNGPAVGFDAYASRDLVQWEGPIPVFRPEPGFWATENFWAPEVHRYGDRYFMFASFKAPERPRATQILAAAGPRGPFRPHSDGPVTPSAWECLDGTLYIDPHGQPWMVFCHEWVQVRDGEMCAMPLAPDFTHAAGEPLLLFHASDAPWARAIGEHNSFITDGPFLWRTAEGTLWLLWSSFGAEGYAIGAARSDNGDIGGPWRQQSDPLYRRDGGHGMLFRTFDGDLRLSIHYPNDSPNERPLLLAVVEEAGALRIVALVA